MHADYKWPDIQIGLKLFAESPIEKIAYKFGSLTLGITSVESFKVILCAEQDYAAHSLKRHEINGISRIFQIIMSIMPSI